MFESALYDSAWEDIIRVVTDHTSSPCLVFRYEGGNDFETAKCWIGRRFRYLEIKGRLEIINSGTLNNYLDLSASQSHYVL